LAGTDFRYAVMKTLKALIVLAVIAGGVYVGFLV